MKNFFILNNTEYVLDVAYWGRVSPPVYSYIELTKNCNCNCSFCQVEGLHNKNTDMPIKLFKNIIKQLKKEGFLEVRLGGGEPLVTHNFVHYIKILQRYNIKYWVCTNGILMNETIAKLLKETGCIGVRVSIDSIDEETHNSIRGNNNAYIGAWRCVDLIKKFNMYPVVSMTVGVHNAHEIEQLKELATKHNARFTMHPIMPVGRGVNFKSDDDTYACENEEVKDKAFKYAGEKHCVAGTEMVAFDCLGNISPCTFIKPRFSIKHNSLHKILKDKEFVKYTLPIPNSNICKQCGFGEKGNNNCKYASLCRGGCWALEELKYEN